MMMMMMKRVGVWLGVLAVMVSTVSANEYPKILPGVQPTNGNANFKGNNTSVEACLQSCEGTGIGCVGAEFLKGSPNTCTVFNAWATWPPETTKNEAATTILTREYTPLTPPPVSTPPKGARPIIFLMHDDLRPSIDAADYGQGGLELGHTPNFKRLADTGLSFRHAYINYPYCAPSRNSYMSGRRPDATKALSFIDTFREKGVGDQWWSLPELFKRNGYTVAGQGKTYHPGVPPFDDQNRSWTLPYHQGSQNATNTCKDHCCGSTTPWLCLWELKEDTYLEDQDVVNVAVQRLNDAAKDYKENGTPFAMFIGTHKPHLNWDTPMEAFNRIPDNITAATHLEYPANAPPIHFHNCAEMSAQYWNSDGAGAQDRSVEWQAYMRRAYLGCISYVDGLVGEVLDALEATGLEEDTVIVTTGDHGWRLGEGDGWCKMRIDEDTTRVPLIIRDYKKPQSQGKVTSALAELVDIYPTLAELAGLELPTGPGGEYLTGKSLAPILDDPTSTVKDVALQQMPRCWQNNTFHAIMSSAYGPGDEHNFTNSIDNMSDCHWVWRGHLDFMGYAIRTATWRYIEWLKWNGTALAPIYEDVEGMVEANMVELYNHTLDMGTAADFDLWEFDNLAGRSENLDLVKQLSTKLRSTVGKYNAPLPKALA